MHLLATASASLDEMPAAVDLAQTPADIVVLSFGDSDLTALAAAWSGNAATLPSLRLASLRQLAHPLSVDLYIERVVAKSRLVIVRGLGGLDYWRYGFERLAEASREHGVLLAALPGDDRPDARLTELSTVPAESVALLDRYFRDGGSDNLNQALLLAANLLGADFVLAPPVPIGAAVAMATDGASLDIETVSTAHGEKPTALLLFYRSALLAADTQPIRALAAALQARGLAPLAVAVTSLKDPAATEPLSRLITRRRPAIILNATAFSALRDDDTTVLDAADVPVLQVALAGASHDSWTASPRGLGAADIAMNVALPELDGRLFTRAISFKAPTALDPRLEYAAVAHTAVPDRVDYIADLAAAWVRLARKPAAERRLAVMLSDYPARGGRTGYAVGLDTAASVVEILSTLRSSAYDTGCALDAAEIMPALETGSPTLDIPLSDYSVWLARLPASLQSDINTAWGDPSGDPAFESGNFRFRAIHAGHITILLQPDRGARVDRKSSYHDTTLPPRHAYVALYAFLRETARIDALIHLGTHGTLEWLPGKALALSAACAPEAVLGPVPVIYPFIVNNPGEAIQAKRRLSAVTIGHMTPPLSKAGLDGALAALEGLIEEYAEAEVTDRRRAALIETEILDQARRSGLAAECGLAPDAPARDVIAQLDARLCDIKELAIRDGLHVWGQAPAPQAQAALADAIARSSGLGDRSLTDGLIAERINQCAAAERQALLAALDGRRVAPGPSGAPTRGRLDVLPTGRNMTTLDPRSIPTRTAATIGARAADEVLRRYLQQHGDYPRSVFIDLWASSTLRTGGDDLAQALSYLGVRPVWDHASNRVTGVETIPLPKLDRPRIDVTLRMSGLFRDVFDSQIALIASAVRLVAGLDEDAEWNPLAEARRRGADLQRIFGSAPGTYGAGAAELVLDGQWSTTRDIAEAYLSSTSTAFDGRGNATPAAPEFRSRVAGADALVHTQDDRERDLLDGDGVADFVGGFASAAAVLGRTPALYHLDTSRPDAPVARTVADEIARVVRGRLTNPRWLAGQLRHGHRGVAEIAQGVDALYAFAATTDAVAGALFDAVHDALVADETRVAIMQDANPKATVAILDRLDDALARGLWTPRRNAVHAEIARLRASAGGAA